MQLRSCDASTALRGDEADTEQTIELEAVPADEACGEPEHSPVPTLTPPAPSPLPRRPRQPAEPSRYSPAPGGQR